VRLVIGTGQGHFGGRQLHPSHWESPHPPEAKPSLLGSLVVDAKGVEDIQEGRDEGEELHKRKKSKSWGHLGDPNPISSACSSPGEPSQPRALSSLIEGTKPPQFPGGSHARLSMSCWTLRSPHWLHNATEMN